jgi:hypothetical protein
LQSGGGGERKMMMIIDELFGKVRKERNDRDPGDDGDKLASTKQIIR